MLDKEQQELAEFGAEFLGFKIISESELKAMGMGDAPGVKRYDMITDAWCHDVFEVHTYADHELPDLFFNSLRSSPILMHLGQEKMEGLCFCMQSITLKMLDVIDLDGNITKKGYLHKFDFALDNNPWKADYSESKFFAFWKAVEATGVLDAK